MNCPLNSLLEDYSVTGHCSLLPAPPTAVPLGLGPKLAQDSKPLAIIIYSLNQLLYLNVCSFPMFQSALRLFILLFCKEQKNGDLLRAT